MELKKGFYYSIPGCSYFVLVVNIIKDKKVKCWKEEGGIKI